MRFQRGGLQHRQRAGAGTAGEDVEPALGVAHRCLRQRHAAGDDVAQVARRRQAKLHIDVGQAEIGVEQQHAAALARQDMRQGDGEPGLADAALAGGDGDAARLRHGTGREAWGGFRVCSRRSASKAGVSGTRPSAAPGPMPASVSARRRPRRRPARRPGGGPGPAGSRPSAWRRHRRRRRRDRPPPPDPARRAAPATIVAPAVPASAASSSAWAGSNGSWPGASISTGAVRRAAGERAAERHRMAGHRSG